MSTLPQDANERKSVPMARGLLDYFPAALAAVATLSLVANEQHNPGEELHWAREKSTDHADCIIRHLVDRGRVDSDGISHTTKVAWRALALLQEELEAEGAPPGRASAWPASASPEVHDVEGVDVEGRLVLRGHFGSRPRDDRPFSVDGGIGSP